MILEEVMTPEYEAQLKRKIVRAKFFKDLFDAIQGRVTYRHDEPGQLLALDLGASVLKRPLADTVLCSLG